MHEKHYFTTNYRSNSDIIGIFVSLFYCEIFLSTLIYCKSFIKIRLIKDAFCPKVEEGRLNR